MPALPTIPNVVEAVLFWSLGADTQFGTKLHWKYEGGPPNATQLHNCAQQLSTVGNTSFSHNHNSSVTSTTIRLTDLASHSGERAEVAGWGPGVRLGASNAAAVCCLVNYPIKRRYRGGKPRSYYPWGTITDLAGPDKWTAAFQTEAKEHLTAWVLGSVSIASEGFHFGNPQVVSYYSGGEWKPTSSGGYVWKPHLRAEPLVEQPTDYLINPIPGTQRTRYKRGG